MLRLIVNEKGQLENRWIPDFEIPKWPGITILGPAKVDANGKIENPEWLVKNGEVVSVDPTAKQAEAAKLEQARTTEVLKKQEATDRHDRLKSLDLSKPLKLDELQAIVKDLVESK